MDLEQFLLNKKIVLISNYKITPEIEQFTLSYDCVIRFNIGSNIKILNQYNFYNNKTDISVLSGWSNHNFGPMNGFQNQKILFSRPKCEQGIKYFYKHICVKQDFENTIKNYAQSINYIPLQVFYDFYHEYRYDHPTTGLIVLYYITKYLKINVDCINFYIDNKLYNTFSNSNSMCHKVFFERKILHTLNIKQHII